MENIHEDKLTKYQFWVRESLYEEARRVAPNRGEMSDLMREGLELAIAAWKQRRDAYQRLPETVKAS
jgi:hypothetical protein